MSENVEVSLGGMARDDAVYAAFDACIDSLEDLCGSPATPNAALVILERLVEHVIQLSPCVIIVCLAFRADKPFVSIKPTEHFLVELIAATTVYLDQSSLAVVFRHGWPILTLDGVATPSMTEAGVASSRSGGGAA